MTLTVLPWGKGEVNPLALLTENLLRKISGAKAGGRKAKRRVGPKTVPPCSKEVRKPLEGGTENSASNGRGSQPSRSRSPRGARGGHKRRAGTKTGPPPRSDDLGASPRATQPRRPARPLRPGGRVTSQRGHIIYSALGAVRQGRMVGLGGGGPWAWRPCREADLGLGPWGRTAALGLGPCMEAAALGPLGRRPWALRSPPLGP